MENDKRSNDNGIIDPLAKYWGLSLFPSTFSAPHSKPYDDLDTIHNHLKSMALRSPAKVVEQTKAIVGDDLEQFISENSTHDERNDVVVAEQGGEEFPRRRRPGLDCKRAPPRFSLKQPKKPTLEDLLPPLNIDNLKDPVEFFMAHERWENAKKEIEKQLGIVPSQDNVSTKPRQRRPGLPGYNRRPVKYTHRYSTEDLDNNDDVLSSQKVSVSGSRDVPSSQEVFGSSSCDPVDERTDKEGACLTPMENNVTENKLDDILQGLLRCDPEDLEGDGAMNLLQERLQIKPIVIEKLSLPDLPNFPDFPDSQVSDLKSLRGNLSKPRKALSNIDNLLKGMNNKTPIRRNSGCTVKTLGSPTPPRSPFALLSSLQQHISRSKSSVDPFSANEIGNVSTERYSPTHMISQEVNVGSGKPSNELNAHMIEDDIAASETNTNLDTYENSKEDSSGKVSDKLNAPLIKDLVAVSETSLDEDPARNSTSTSQKFVVDNSKEPVFDANVDSNEPHVGMDVDIGESGMEKRAMADTVGMQNIEPNKRLEENTQAFTASMPTIDMDSELVNPLADQSSPVEILANSVDKRRSDDEPEHSLQEKRDGTVASVNGQKRAKLHSRKESKDKRLMQKKRQSLGAAGTSWKSGLRRSTRNRTRPLEYWKGERPVYGRVHESLTTVIGVKCLSPGTDGKPKMKVKSYVSDKHKELLEIASLY